MEFLARQSRGDSVDFESVCAAHPEHADELRLLYGRWLDVAPMLQSALPDLVDSLTGVLPEEGPPPSLQAALSMDLDAGGGEETPIELVDRLTSHQGATERYRADGEIGRGGMGEVHKVWDGNLQRFLAKKVMLENRPALDGADIVSEPDSEPSSSTQGSGRRNTRELAQFLSEALVTGQLDHPGIVPVHELGLDADGRPFFTMKLVKGRNLRTVFKMVARGEEGWTLNRALGSILRVCEAVAYAHSKGVMHRDIKPDNIMVGKFGETYLIDWGLAKLLAPRREEATEPGEKVSPPVEADEPEAQADREPDPWWLSRDRPDAGTPVYMSPEQAWGRHALVDERSDIYSLGAILYHLLTRRMPYVSPDHHPTRLEIVLLVRRECPVPILELNPDAPPTLVSICQRAMARDIDERYATAAEMAAALEDYLEDISEAREEARRQARRAELINDFLVNMISSVDPASAQGRDTTLMLEVLRDAAQRIETELPGQPLDQAALRVTIGSMHKQLGDFAQAEVHLEQALETTEELLGADHRDTIKAAFKLGVLRWHQERLDEAERLLQHVLDVQRRDLGSEHRDTLGTMFALALVLERFEGRTADAEELMRSSFEGRRALLGDSHADTLESLNGLAQFLTERRRFEEALVHQRQALEGRRRVEGETHPNTLAAANNLARILQALGDLPAAEALMRETFESQRRVMGEDHPWTLTCMNNLALNLSEQGQLDEAEALIVDAVDRARDKLGALHTKTLSYMNTLAMLREKQGRLDEAERLYRDIVRRAGQALSPEHRYTARFRTHLGRCLLSQGRRQDAGAELRDAHTALLAALGPKNDWTREAAAALGDAEGRPRPVLHVQSPPPPSPPRADRAQEA